MEIQVKIYADIYSSGETPPIPQLKSKLGLNYQIHTEKVTLRIGNPSPRTLETDLAKKIFPIKLKFGDGF